MVNKLPLEIIFISAICIILGSTERAVSQFCSCKANYSTEI